MWDHMVLPATRQEVTFPPLTQPKRVLDLATPKGRNARQLLSPNSPPSDNLVEGTEAYSNPITHV